MVAMMQKKKWLPLYFSLYIAFTQWEIWRSRFEKVTALVLLVVSSRNTQNGMHWDQNTDVNLILIPIRLSRLKNLTCQQAWSYTEVRLECYMSTLDRTFEVGPVDCWDLITKRCFIHKEKEVFTQRNPLCSIQLRCFFK